MADEKEETVLDAMNEALGDLISPESTESTDDTSATDSGPDGDGSDEHSADDQSDDEGDTEGDEAEGDAEESDATITTGEELKGPNGERERNPDGTWKKAEPPKKDPINDPIPENLKKDTSERIRSLIETAKTVTAERDQYKTDFDFLVKGVEATGTTPAQYGETLSWLALFNNGIKGDSAQLEKAYELVEQVADRCALLLGKDRNIADPLKAHTDLQEAVRTGKLTPEYAKEIARTRNGQQFRTELTSQATAAEQAQAEAAQELKDGRAALTELEQTLMASDPNYAAKKAVLVPALQPIFRKGADGNYIVRPSQWKDRFVEAYRNVRVGAPAAQPKPVVPKNQPLRAGKQPAGGQSREPNSMLDAISGALNNMGGK